jgi:hypothetical protein
MLFPSFEYSIAHKKSPTLQALLRLKIALHLIIHKLGRHNYRRGPNAWLIIPILHMVPRSNGGIQSLHTVISYSKACVCWEIERSRCHLEGVNRNFKNNYIFVLKECGIKLTFIFKHKT